MSENDYLMGWTKGKLSRDEAMGIQKKKGEETCR